MCYMQRMQMDQKPPISIFSDFVGKMEMWMLLKMGLCFKDIDFICLFFKKFSLETLRGC